MQWILYRQFIDESRLQANLAKAEIKDAAELKREELEHRAAEIRASFFTQNYKYRPYAAYVPEFVLRKGFRLYRAIYG